MLGYHQIVIFTFLSKWSVTPTLPTACKKFHSTRELQKTGSVKKVKGKKGWQLSMTSLVFCHSANNDLSDNWIFCVGGGGTVDYFEPFCAISTVPMVLIKGNIY